MKKKLLALLLALAAVVSLLTFPASAAEIVDSGTCGENLTWTLDSDGLLVISGTGDMDTLTGSENPWDGNSDIRTVKIEYGVTNIKRNAFAYCENLTNVSIPESVTSIEMGAFFKCTSLTSVTIPDSVTTIGKAAFEYCYSLSNVTLSKNTTHYTMDTFYGCKSLPRVTIPYGVVYIGVYMFDACENLTVVTIPDSVTGIGYSAFYSAVTDVYYTGSEEQWNNISCSGKPFTDNTTIHYNYHPASLAAQPQDYNGLVNSLAKFTISASGDGLKYQWQYSDDNGATWLDSSLKSATYSAKLTAEKDGRMVRCIVTDVAGNSVISDPAAMRVVDLKINTQPADYIGEVNSTAKFTVSASGTGLKYQWQYSDDDGATWLASSIKSATYSAKFTAEKNGRMVRCIVTDASGNSVTSNAAKMILAHLMITSQPQNYVGAVNSTAKFTVAAYGDGLKYQWQYSDDNGATWLASSIKSATYSAKFTADKSNRMVRCIITDASGNTVTSNAAKMILSRPVITTQPQNYIGAANSTARFTVAAAGDGLTYQWQYSDDSGATWLVSSIKSSTYSAKLTAEKDWRHVRCVITDASGNSATTNAVFMRIG